MKNTGTRVRGFICFLLALGTMALIFFFSSQSGKVSDHTSLELTNWLQQQFHLAMTQVQLDHLLRKAAHFTVYLLLAAFLAGWLSAFAWQAPSWLLVTVLTCALYAAGDEYHQSFVPYRAPSGWDVLLDTAGALLGTLLVLLIWAISHHNRAEAAGVSVICPNCGYDNPGDVVCCVKCGEPLVDSSKLFVQSGEQLAENTEDEEDTGAAANEVVVQPVPRKRSSGVGLAILVISLCLAGTVVSFSVAWYQERGTWPWGQQQTVPSSGVSHSPLLSRKTTATYEPADLVAAVRASGFQQFSVVEAEISNIQVDSQSVEGADLVQFTVGKPMATLHMQLRFPTRASDTSTPSVTTWGVDEWTLTGTWNDANGDALVIDSCSGGAVTAVYVPAGTVSGRTVNGTVSETGELSLLNSKVQVSGRFSPSGTAFLTVTAAGGKPQTQRFVILSVTPAVISKPAVSSGSASSASSATSSKRH